MPELPEVETVMQGLRPVMEGARIKQLVQRRPDLRFPMPDGFEAALSGRIIERLQRRAKYMLFHFDKGPVLLVHLGMSGQMIISPAGTHHSAPAKHDHVLFDMEDGARISFADPRRFGMMVFADRDAPESHKLLANLGPDPLSNSFSEAGLSAALKPKKTPIKSALLDQRIVAGLGNIYVCEALFRAGISPKRQASTVAGKRAQRLKPVIVSVLQDAIAAGGSSLKDYRQADGALGYFQHAFDVYDREGEACRKQGCTGTVRRIVQSGRSSFYCPTCQR